MLSATSGTVRIGARRIATRVASIAVAPMPEAFLGRSSNMAQARSLSSTGRLSYAINTNPNPPLGKKNAFNETPSRIGLIGARGYTGQALIDLLNEHPNMEIRHVSSRELNGQELKGYTKRKIIYENLSPEEVAQLDKDGKVDCWVMALPNGVCQPFVQALGQSSSLIIDLSADYRFDSTWGSYGLPELVQRSKIAESTRISCPGCYSTGSQLALAPILEHVGAMPTVFGISGYSGAGTKPSPKNDVNLLHENLLPCKS
jgi:N-acetyl-gamma-glutamyl-phosphate reductase/acetylglutamate kinase